MSRRFALFLSVLFHPVFTNLIAVILLFYLYPQLNYGVNHNLKWFYIGFIFITTGVIPVLIVLLLKVLHKNSSILLDDKEERNLPYMITASLYLFDFFLSRKTGGPSLISAYLLACSAIVVAVLIINQLSKISIHAASLGALTGVISCAFQVSGMDIRYLILASVILGGLVISARLFLESHTSFQVYAGYVAGLLIMWFIL